MALINDELLKTKSLSPKAYEANSIDTPKELDLPYPKQRDVEITPDMLTEVTPKMTVAGQMKELLDADSPYMQQARTQAAQASAGRGLLNTAMQRSAGEYAARQAALPIATEDAKRHFESGNINAQRYFDAALESARSSNQFALEFGKLSREGMVDLEKGYAENATKIIGAAAQEIGKAMTTSGLTPEAQARALRLIETRRDADLQALADLYTGLPSWNTAWSQISVAAA